MNNDSPWPAAHDSRIDRAIDRAVREMVQVDPRPGLRRRVLRRLEADPRPWPRIGLRYASVAAALAIVIATVIFTRDRGIEPDANRIPARSAAAAAPAPPNPPHAGTPDSDHSTAPSGLDAQPKRPDRRSARAPVTTREEIRMPPVANVFGTPARGGAAAAAADADVVWQPPADALPEQPGGLPPLVIAPLETPAVVIPALAPAPPKGGQ